jgi:hypothetical protein
MTTENKPGLATNGQTENEAAASTPQQMMNLLQVQALSLNMNNAVSTQQNAYTVNSAIVSSICTRILSAGKPKEAQPTAS